MKNRYVFCLFLFVNSFTAFLSYAADITPPDAARVEAYEKMLPPSPQGVGPTIDDRQAWEALKKHPSAAKIIIEAEKMLETPLPELTDDLFLEYSRSGDRDRCQAVIFKRQDRVSLLVLAECFENRGRFVPALEATIRSICKEKTWVFPAHDGALLNFKGAVIEIDLNSSYYSWNLALTAYWLGDRLSPEVRKLLAENLERRTFTPFTNLITTGKPPMWWLTSEMNWNSVCLAGVTGAALTSIESPQRRAFFAAAAEKYIKYYLQGFTPDGYCSEGLGYWNYGFGHFALLAETLKQATHGEVDLLADEKLKPIVTYPRRMEILPGIYPAFADSHIDVKPDPRLIGFLSRRLNLGWRDFEKLSLETNPMNRARLFEAAIFVFPDFAHQASQVKAEMQQALRDWFSDAGVLICRPAPNNTQALAAALKGGHNAENHNHNDLGSFVVALGSSTPLLDPGSEVYTKRTFGPKRYDSNVLNSLGHPVPRVAGKLQETGRQAQANILKTHFSDLEDTLVMDISSAYKVPDLKKLERTFIFSRKGKGKLTIIDEVEFDHPQMFGIALITFSKWRQTAPDRLEIGEGKDIVDAVIAATGAELSINAEEISENLPDHKIPLRLGIELTKPVEKTSVTVTIKPR